VVHGRDARRVVPIAEATLEALEMRGDLDRGSWRSAAWWSSPT